MKLPTAVMAALLLTATASSVSYGQASENTPPRLAKPDSVAKAIAEAYPREYERERIGGVVGLRAFVDTAGKADSIQVTSSTGIARIDRAARNVLSRSRFIPGAGPDGPEGAWVDIDMIFGLRAPPGFTDPPPAVTDRAQLVADIQRLYPEDLRTRRFYETVPVILRIDAQGRVVSGSSTAMGCLTSAIDAAQEVFALISFEPARAGEPPLRETAVTLTFADSVLLLVRGDHQPPPSPAEETTADTLAEEGEITRRPELRNQRAVQQALVRNYPRRLRDAGLGGKPVIWVWINVEGRVEHVSISETSGSCDLDIAAMEVASLMRFSPALSKGVPKSVYVELPIVFYSQR